MLSLIRRTILEGLSLEHDKQANQSLFSTIAQTVQILIAIPGFYAIGALTTPQGFFLAMATNFTTELIGCELYLRHIRPIKDQIKSRLSSRFSTNKNQEAEDEDRFLAIQYANEEFGERLALLSALLLAGTLESNLLALLYRLPAAYACEEATDLIRGIICRNHGIYLSHIKIRLNWNSVGTLACCIWCVSSIIMAGLGVAEFLVV